MSYPQSPRLPQNKFTDPDEIGNLLEQAEDAFPESDFVQSIKGWFESKGFITQKQRDGLVNTISNSRRKE